MKFTNTKVYNLVDALRGMRNAKNSWSRNDSREYRIIDALGEHTNFIATDYNVMRYENTDAICVEIGPNDMKLAQALVAGGSPHRKFLRQILVSVDITAPLYWWKEADTYKVGTTANSTSTMHKLAQTPITLDCFEIDDYDTETATPFIEESLIPYLEKMRQMYNATKEKKYWKELIRWLPEGWLQTRTITLNYEVLYTMCEWRAEHKLNEWSGKDNPELHNFIAWVHTLPYADELIFYRPKKKTNWLKGLRDWLAGNDYNRQEWLDMLASIDVKTEENGILDTAVWNSFIDSVVAECNKQRPLDL